METDKTVPNFVSIVRKSYFKQSERGMSLVAVMAVLTLVAISLLAVAPTVMQGVQREKELEAIQRGEEVAEAIRQYVMFYKKLPESMDDLLQGLPHGTKKRQILRASSAVDPLSEDGKWRLIEPTGKTFINFGRRLQIYNNGLLPSNPQPSQLFDQYTIKGLVNVLDTKSDEDLKEESEEEIEVKTDKTPFIGVASQSRSRSVIAYYGIENHSKWVFTPLFRGTGTSAINQRNDGSGGALGDQFTPTNNGR